MASLHSAAVEGNPLLEATATPGSRSIDDTVTLGRFTASSHSWAELVGSRREAVLGSCSWAALAGSRSWAALVRSHSY